MRRWFVLLLPLLISLSAAAQTKAPSAAPNSEARLPVKKVVLYKNGVGYFEHAGRVRGTQEVAIDFTTGQLNDVLKSLTVLDLGGGRIAGVRYNSVAPVNERLKGLRLPIGEQTTRADFLAALRGARVEVTSGATRSLGKLLSVENVTRKDPRTDSEYQQTEFAIVTDAGELRSYELRPGTSVRVAERELNQEVGRYLDLIGSSRAADVRRMTISATGQGDRDLFVSYISEVPVWKTTYRVVLPMKPGDKPMLQGWAIVDNTVGEDWKDVQLSLVAGAPQSFIQQISQPYYVRRPTVALPESVSLAPQTHEGTLREVEVVEGVYEPEYGKSAGGTVQVTDGAFGGARAFGGVVGGLPGTGAARGNLAGTVYDPTGAIVPGARVDFRSHSTQRSTATDDEGHFVLPLLPPGFGSITVTKQGFKIAAVRSIEVAPNRTTSVRVNLEPGAVSETMEVSAAAVTVNTSSTAVGSNLSDTFYSSVPAAGLRGLTGLTVDSEAETVAVGDLFEYAIRQKITIGKNQSALVPIVQAPIEVEKVTIWNAAQAQPLRALWLTNSSGLTLDGGAFNVLEEGSFAGEGLLDTLRPAEKRLISYAADTAVRIRSEDDASNGPVTRVTVIKGLMRLTREHREKTTYTVRNSDTASRTVVVERPARSQWKLTGAAKPEETSGSYHRFRVAVEPDKTTTLVVEEAKPDQSDIYLSNLTDEQVALFLEQKTITPQQEAAFRRVLNQKTRVGEVDLQISERQKEINSIVADQNRLRENMKALKGSPEEKLLLSRYTRQLNEQEDRLAALRNEIDKLRQTRQGFAAELDRIIQEISFDEAVPSAAAGS